MQEKHDLLAAVIKGMQHFLHAIDNRGKTAYAKVSRTMLLYIIDHRNKVRHPKEDQYQFPLLRQRASQVDQMLDAL